MKDLVLKHDADHAGGGKEVVYSSDGADLPPMSFPIKTKHSEIDESELIPPEQAFQIFANKLYTTNPYNKNLVKESIAGSDESPLVRLERLKSELETLEMECSSKSDFGLFQDQLLKIKGQLHSLSSSHMQNQTGLSTTIDASVAAINAPHIVDTTTLSTVSSNVASENSSRLIVRINRLEKVLGSETGDQTSLIGRVNNLENLLSKLDDKKLDLLQKRSKVIRQDLEAAAKARNKLSSSSNSGLSSSDDSKIIATLYDGLQNLQGMSEHLPILSARLQALAHQHADAATRTARFKAVEQMTTDLSKKVQSIDTALSSLDKSMKENTTVMYENVNALEERMKQEYR
jgi:Dynamitin